MYEYADMLVNGFAMLWFIVILPVFFVVTRLTRHVSPWLMLPAAVLLQVFPYHNESWLLVGHFCERFVYFYLGYRAAPLVFQWAQWAHGNRPAALAAVLGWGVLNQAAVSAGYTTGPGFALVSGLVGSMAVITVGVLLSRFAAMHWLRYLGEHSIVTYLAFFLPMGALIVVMKRTGLWLDPGSMAANDVPAQRIVCPGIVLAHHVARRPACCSSGRGGRACPRDRRSRGCTPGTG